MLNWAGNYEYRATRIERPATFDDVGPLVAAASHVHGLGTRHCFNDIADMPGGVLISTENLTRIVSVDTAGPRPTVTIESGVTYSQLNAVLHDAGLALPNLASLPHITVAGATATATHGSGANNGCLSTSVSAIEFVTADGSPRTLRRGDADFDGAVVHLGALGVVTKLTLDLVPAFEIAQRVYQRVPIAVFADAYETVLASAYSVSVFTSWQTDAFEQVWLKSRPGETPFALRTLGGAAATADLHPIENVVGAAAFEGLDPASATQQGGIAGPWHERLPHFRAGRTPSAGAEIQSEYFVPREHAKAAIAAVRPLRDAIRPLIQISELRAIAADKLWMSPFYDRPSFALHFTWRRDPAGVLALLPKLEAALAPFDCRPHWGKVSTLERPARRYPKVDAFRQLRARFDPSGKFHTPYLDRVGL